MKFTTTEIRGIKFDIDVNDDGSFRTTLDGETLKAPTLDQLKKKLNEHTRAKQKNVKIPFVYWDEADWSDSSGKIVHGVAVGIHVGNGNLLARLGGGDTQQLRGYHRSERYFDPKHAAQLEKLWKAKEAAKKAIEEFAEEHAIEDLKKLVEKAIGEEK